MTPRQRRIDASARCTAAAFMAAVLPALVIAACSNDTEESSGTGPTAETSTVPEQSPDALTENKSAIQTVHAQYWAARVAAQNTLNADPAQFAGITSDEFAEELAGSIQNRAEEQRERTGEPTLTDEKITVEGDTARAEACFDESSWGTIINGTTMPPVEPDPVPVVIEFERPDGQWIVVGHHTEGTTLTC